MKYAVEVTRTETYKAVVYVDAVGRENAEALADAQDRAKEWAIQNWGVLKGRAVLGSSEVTAYSGCLIEANPDHAVDVAV